MSTLEALNHEAAALLLVAPERAGAMARSICERAAEADDHVALAIALCTLASAAAAVDDPDEAQVWLARAEELDAHITLPCVRLRWFTARAEVAHLRGDPKEALLLIDDALLIAERLDERFEQARLLDLLGTVHRSWGAMQSALRCHTEARELFEHLGHAGGQIRASTHVAADYAALGQHDLAVEAIELSMTSARTLADRQLETQRQVQLCVNLNAMGRHEEALAHLADLLPDNSGAPPVLRTAVHSALAETLMGLRRFPEALEHLRHCQILAGATDAHEVSILTSLTHGRLHLQQGAFEAARQVLLQTLQATERLGLLPLQVQTHLHLSEAHRGLGRFEEALHHHERYHAIKEEVFGLEANRRIEGVIAQLEVERLRRERELERLRTTELERVNAELAAKNQELERLNQRLAELSTRDPLTQLYNRRYIDQHLTHEILRVQRYGEPLSVAMLDVDHFKRVNDTLSHAVGDLVLIELAQLLRANTRGIDVAGRYGGEEFLLILAHTPDDVALEVAEKLRGLVEDHHFAGEHALSVTVSIGVAGSRRDDTPGALIARADEALYRAKALGRNRVVGPTGPESTADANKRPGPDV